jgi:16S rRNA (guanine527-N7)-methyltransferase
VDQATIARLLQPYAAVDEGLLLSTSTYIDLLLKWNTKINLTGVRDPQEMVTRHFGESFFAAEKLISHAWQGSVIDVGSGAGFPGVPLAMYAPGAQVTLVESLGKKASFLREVIYALHLRNAKVFSQRAEKLDGLADLVTMRAVERFEKALPTAARLVRPGGAIALLIGAMQVGRAQGLAADIDWEAPVGLSGGNSRVLLTGTKRVKVE